MPSIQVYLYVFIWLFVSLGQWDRPGQSKNSPPTQIKPLFLLYNLSSGTVGQLIYILLRVKTYLVAHAIN